MKQGSGGKSKRKREDILTGILISALHGSSKTRIMYDNELNFNQLKNYLNYAINNGLLEVREGDSGKSVRSKQIYFTTNKGIEYLRLHKKISDISNDNNDSNSIIVSDTLIDNYSRDRGEL